MAIYAIPNFYEYLTPVDMMLCVAAASGGTYISSLISTKAKGDSKSFLANAWSVVGVIVVGIVPFAINHALCDHSKSTFMRSLALNVLDALPPDAVVITRGDNVVFPLWYAQDVLRHRRDVLVVDEGSFTILPGVTPATSPFRWYFEHIDKIDPAVKWESLAPTGDSPTRYMWTGVQAELQRSRPLFVCGDLLPGELSESANNMKELSYLSPSVVEVPHGIVWRIVPAASVPSVVELARDNTAACNLLKIDLPPTTAMDDDHEAGDFIFPEYALACERTGQMWAQMRNLPDANAWLAKASMILPYSAPLQNEYAVTCMEIGHHADAAEAWQKAVSLNPSNQQYQAYLSSARQSQ